MRPICLTALFVLQFALQPCLSILPMLQYSAYLPHTLSLMFIHPINQHKLINFQLVNTAFCLTALFVLGILPMLQYSAYFSYTLVCFALCITLLFVLHFALEPLCKSYRSA